MEQKEKNCCTAANGKSDKGILAGVLYGLLPHSFCIAFALFSIIGAVTATTLLKKFMLIPNFFYFLVLTSLLLATVSSAFYLKRSGCLCASGVKGKWKYITTLYSTTILINLLMFFVIFPALANAGAKNQTVLGKNSAELSIKVKIPCPGHAPLITDEIKKESGVESVEFETPDKFQIKYDPGKTTSEEITSLEIFKNYEATIIN
jgi:hypothetical protein